MSEGDAVGLKANFTETKELWKATILVMTEGLRPTPYPTRNGSPERDRPPLVPGAASSAEDGTRKGWSRTFMPRSGVDSAARQVRAGLTLRRAFRAGKGPRVHRSAKRRGFIDAIGERCRVRRRRIGDDERRRGRGHLDTRRVSNIEHPMTATLPSGSIGQWQRLNASVAVGRRKLARGLRRAALNALK